jgi:hypothetical protein
MTRHKATRVLLTLLLIAVLPAAATAASATGLPVQPVQLQVPILLLLPALATMGSAIFTAGVAVTTARMARRVIMDDSLIKRRNEITDALLRYQVRGPFAVLLGITEEQNETFRYKACLLILHVNLLEQVFQNKNLIRDGGVKMNTYEDWARQILTPWINSDVDLQRCFHLIAKTNDVMDADFVKWMMRHVDVPEPASAGL